MRRLLFLADDVDRHLGRVLSSESVEYITYRDWSLHRATEIAFAEYNIVHKTRNLPEFIQSRIPEHVLEANRRGRLGIILDNSGEANPISHVAWGELYDFFERFGLCTRLIVHVSQNVRAPSDHTTFCRNTHVPEPICVTRYHWFLKRLIDEHCSGPAPDRPSIASQLHNTRHREAERLALCFMYKARPHRIKLAILMLKHGIWDQSLVSFGGLKPTDWGPHHMRVNPNESIDQIRDQMQSEDLDQYLPLLINKGRILLETEDPLSTDPLNARAPDMVYDLAEAAYQRTRFSIVAESEMTNMIWRFTEKSIKPFANGHPMIVFGNPLTLHFLRELGFGTFGGLIDESYDEIMRPTERFDAAFEEVKRLAAMTHSEWIRARHLIDDVLIYNSENFFINLPAIFERVIEKPFLRELEARATAAEAVASAARGAL